MLSLRNPENEGRFQVVMRCLSSYSQQFKRLGIFCVMVSLLVGFLWLPGYPLQVVAHSGDEVTSSWSLKAVTMDGDIGSGEWTDATELDLMAVDVNNEIEAYLYLKNDNDYLYAAYDAVGDTQIDDNDHASLGFDTGHDAIETDGEEHQFFQGTPETNEVMMLHPPGNQVHFVYSPIASTWVTHCNPFNPAQVDHTGLMGNISFGVTPREPGTDHRTFEFRIPLSLLGISPGDTIGFIGGSQLNRGVEDFSTNLHSSWPAYFASNPTLPEYGNLILSTSPGDLPPVVDAWRPGEGPGEVYSIGDQLTVEWLATDDNAMPSDNINITYGSAVTWTPINGDVYSHVNDGSEVWDTTGVAPGDYYVKVSAYDSIGQETYSLSNYTIELVAVVVDDTPPEISDVTINGLTSPSYVISSVPTLLLNATVSDSNTGGSSIEMANYTIGAQAWPGTNMTAKDGDFDETTEDVGTSIDASSWGVGSYSICVYAFDVIGNANVTGTCVSVNILQDGNGNGDTEPPSIALNVNPVIIEEGETTNISALITDDVELDDSSVAVRILDEDDEEIGNYTLSTGLQRTDSTYWIENEYDTHGTYTITVWASDTSGNWNSVSDTFTVEKAVVSDLGWLLWVLVIVIIVIVVAVLLAFLLRRRKKTEMDEPEEPPAPEQESG
jgi:hypothetical protein